MATSAVCPQHNVRLAKYTTLGIGGEPDFFFEPHTFGELEKACRTAWSVSDEVRVLGGGNLFVTDGRVRGAVISMRRFEPAMIEQHGSCVRVSAGVRTKRLVDRCAEWGLSGLECLVGIPGTIGGAIAMNAGGHKGTLGDRVRFLEIIDSDGQLRRLNGSDVQWGYRSADVGRGVIVFAELELSPSSPVQVKEYCREIFERKAATQPLSLRSAGCFFRNPQGDSAGRLLDAAGLKGMRVGGAGVSHKHANFLVNQDRATSADIMALVEQVQRAVMDRFQVRLENEVKYWL